MPFWPAACPRRPLQGSLTITRASGPEASDLGVGPPRLRRRTSSVGERMSMTFIMDIAGREAFDTLYDTDLSNGSSNFTMPHPIDGVHRTFVFDAAPVVAAITDRLFRVSVKLYREP